MEIFQLEAAVISLLGSKPVLMKRLAALIDLNATFDNDSADSDEYQAGIAEIEAFKDSYLIKIKNNFSMSNVEPFDATADEMLEYYYKDQARLNDRAGV